MKFGTFVISNMPISISQLKFFFIRYIPPAKHKLVPKLKMLTIYWNLAHLTFWISRSQFWCQKLFWLSTYHLFDPNCSQNSKCSEFIEIWHIWYFGYPELNLKSKMIFIKYLPPVSRKFVPKLKLQRLYLNLAQLMF